LVAATHVIASGELEATFSPANGMVCSALRHRGEELLGERRGLDVYVEAGKTMGIPLLHPWANRLGGFAYTAGGVEVTIPRDSPEIRLEEHGLPIHGLISALHEWEVVRADDGALAAGRDVTGLAEFPFDHRVELAAELAGERLTLTTTVTPLGDRPVPIAFGHHPYFVIPGVPRAEWELTLPVDEHLLLDADLIPTGEREPAGDLDGPLGERTFDDGYTVDPAGVTFVLSGGGRRIEVAFEQGYPFAQVFAPAVEDVVCFEPMTAPADALRHDPPTVAPGESFSARFSVSVRGRD
jgi:galactose mutarotase-like enzyme